MTPANNAKQNLLSFFFRLHFGRVPRVRVWEFVKMCADFFSVLLTCDSAGFGPFVVDF